MDDTGCSVDDLISYLIKQYKVSINDEVTTISKISDSTISVHDHFMKHYNVVVATEVTNADILYDIIKVPYGRDVQEIGNNITSAVKMYCENRKKEGKIMGIKVNHKEKNLNYEGKYGVLQCVYSVGGKVHSFKSDEELLLKVRDKLIKNSQVCVVVESDTGMEIVQVVNTMLSSDEYELLSGDERINAFDLTNRWVVDIIDTDATIKRAEKQMKLRQINHKIERELIANREEKRLIDIFNSSDKLANLVEELRKVKGM